MLAAPTPAPRTSPTSATPGRSPRRRPSCTRCAPRSKRPGSRSTSADLTMIPTHQRSSSTRRRKAKSVLRLIDALEEHDDVAERLRQLRHPRRRPAIGVRMMDLDDALELRRASTTTRSCSPTGADGSPQMSPVACGVDADGTRRGQHARDRAEDEEPATRPARVAVRAHATGSTATGSRSTAPPRSSRCPTRWSRWSTTTGRSAGEHPDWDDYRAAMVREQRVIVRITLERAGPDRSG